MAGASTLARERIGSECADVNIYDGEDAFYESTKSVPRQSLVLYAVFFCDSEIRNGGLRQLFGNSTGILVPEAIEGFRARDAIDWCECRLGEMGPKGMIRTPYGGKIRLAVGRANDIEWCYYFGYDHRAGTNGQISKP